eukprot:TRINITY_DN6771_c0_g1_i1.p1 TRINITY_DN6771_c0_g1~~TRINITY_DN6771_c0_g1_i1.p1  ORF type:complete len:315 (-),score=28.53 TRINITY_DN6771_c0_g1_i1:947-1891(-)
MFTFGMNGRRRGAWESKGPLHNLSTREVRGTALNSLSSLADNATDDVFLLNVNILSVYAPDRIPMSPFVEMEPILVMRWGTSVFCSTSLWPTGPNRSRLNAYRLLVNQSATLCAAGTHPASPSRSSEQPRLPSRLEASAPISLNGLLPQQQQDEPNSASSSHCSYPELEVFLYMHYPNGSPARERDRDQHRAERNVLLAASAMPISVESLLPNVPGEPVHLALYDKVSHRAGHVTLGLSAQPLPQVSTLFAEIGKETAEGPLEAGGAAFNGEPLVVIISVSADLSEAFIATPEMDPVSESCCDGEAGEQWQANC